ncbi:hypothetical protein EVAR_49908_1 [Eumeta japonica]|uniref:Uncharacterized protein n=1 Tax=Eumeta variegata TaxID=151549 RepID=A0A4C1Y1A3_EUMVA|nr:hypothetical protein EVAR_49908_1 [Eumeta japonica]
MQSMLLNSIHARYRSRKEVSGEETSGNTAQESLKMLSRTAPSPAASAHGVARGMSRSRGSGPALDSNMFYVFIPLRGRRARMFAAR